MITMKRTALLGSALALLLVGGGCASESKKVTGLEQVQQNRAKLDETREKLKRASNELERVQNTVTELQSYFSKSDDITTREKAKTTLERLSLKVQESELDFRELMAQNRSNSNDLDRQLRSVAESSFNQMTGDKKAEAPSDRKTTNQ